MKKSKIDGGFVIIPKRTLRSTQWRDLKQCGKTVFVAMLTEFKRDKKTNPDNEVQITQTQIRAITGLSKQPVTDGIKALKSGGFIEVDPEDQGGLERNYTTYKLKSRFLW